MAEKGKKPSKCLNCSGSSANGWVCSSDCRAFRFVSLEERSQGKMRCLNPLPVQFSRFDKTKSIRFAGRYHYQISLNESIERWDCSEGERRFSPNRNKLIIFYLYQIADVNIVPFLFDEFSIDEDFCFASIQLSITSVSRLGWANDDTNRSIKNGNDEWTNEQCHHWHLWLPLNPRQNSMVKLLLLLVVNWFVELTTE